MKKTLLISEIFPPVFGGSGKWFWDLYGRLSRDEYLIVSHSEKGSKEFDRSHDLNVIRVKLKSSQWGIASYRGFIFYLKTFWDLRKQVKRHNVCALHCGRCIPEGVIGYLFKKLYSMPYLCYIHGEDIETARDSREFILIINHVLKNAQILICNSQNTKSILVEKWNIPEEKLVVLYPGVDAKYFVPHGEDEEARKSLGWHSRLALLTVGRLQKRKGHDMLIRALPLIQREFPNVVYAIIGNGKEDSNLRRLVDELDLNNAVQFFEEIGEDDKLTCIQQADVFILPNRTVLNDIEGFGIVLVEAQSCGIPVVAGDSGGTKETMLPGKTGLIIDCTSVEPIVEAIVNLLKQPALREQMGKYGRQHVLNNLDWDAVLDQAKLVFSRLGK
jgi:phosphatidylinositol alpha-1,6-mannosyltransferase